MTGRAGLQGRRPASFHYCTQATAGACTGRLSPLRWTFTRPQAPAYRKSESHSTHPDPHDLRHSSTHGYGRDNNHHPPVTSPPLPHNSPLPFPLLSRHLINVPWLLRQSTKKQCLPTTALAMGMYHPYPAMSPPNRYPSRFHDCRTINLSNG